MREVKNAETRNRVQALTGLTDEKLDFVVNAATITAALGKFPTKVDASIYLGLTEHEIDILGHEAMLLAWADREWSLKKWYYNAGVTTQPRVKGMVYAIATDLVLKGLLEYHSDGDGRARMLIRSVIEPPQVSSRAQFDGFLVTLEYLKHRERGLGTSFSQFMKLRYGQLRKYNSLAAFSELVASNDPDSFTQSDYNFVVNRLGALLDISRD